MNASKAAFVMSAKERLVREIAPVGGYMRCAFDDMTMRQSSKSGYLTIAEEVRIDGRPSQATYLYTTRAARGLIPESAPPDQQPRSAFAC